MRKTANLICILLATLALAACSYFDAGEVDVSSQPPPAEGEIIDMTTGQPIRALDPQPVNLPEIANRVSDGSVEIIPFDDGATSDPLPLNPSMEPVDAEPLPSMAVAAPPSRFRPNVEIFPLDEAMARIVDPSLIAPADSATVVPPTALSAAAAPALLLPEDKSGGDFVAVGPSGGGKPAMIYFDHDVLGVRQEDIAVLSDIARHYNNNALIEVAGHASVRSSVSDPVQRKIVNLKVSMDRAFSVARALIEAGIPAERIETKAYGETRPPPDAAGTDLEIASRRVEISGVSLQ